ncbi:efflux RND transporter periplasmic adaptor subunit [Chloroflexi bacterium TSY]|nr:efflux RND transporter periplasmic adaptor subunit [Chloroflexi bacterium TSY]
MFLFLLTMPILISCSFGMGARETEEPVVLKEYKAPTLPQNSQKNETTAVATAAASDRQVASTDLSTIVEAVEPAPVREKEAATSDETLAAAPVFVRGDYNGEVVAQSTVSVVGEVSGMALDVTVDVGDRIEKGDLLVRVDSAMLEAQRAQSLAVLQGAQAQLEQLLLDVDPEDMAAANAAVNAAAAAYSDAVSGADVEDLAIAESQMRQVEAAVRRAQSAYNDVKWNPKISMLPQSLELEQTTLQLEAARAQYQKVLNGADDNVIAGAYAQLVQARTQLTNLEEGVKPEQIRAMEAQVRQGEIALYMAQLQLDKTTVEAPMSGAVAQVNITEGGMVNPGTPLVVIVSTDVEITIPVEELRLPDLSIGQSAFIRVNAYPDRVFEGEIVTIAPQLDPQTRTVQVSIRPTEVADELVPGMFAAVDLGE